MQESTILIVLSVCLIVAILSIIVLNRPNFIPETIEDASYQTRFSPTYFEIYDKSTEDMCNRLIIVRPFEWVILANVGQVIILNDTFFDCPLGNTPSVLVPSENPQTEDIQETINFRNVCLKGNFAQILIGYKSVPPVFVKFDIEDGQERNKFTILDALNILFKRYITMNPQIDIMHKNENRPNFKVKHVPNPLLVSSQTPHDFKPFNYGNESSTTQAASRRLKRNLNNMSVLIRPSDSASRTIFHPKKLQQIYETTELARLKREKLSNATKF